MFDYHDTIDQHFCEMTSDRVPCILPDDVGEFQEACYVDAAKGCREMRAYMDQHRCWSEGHVCSFNALVPSLDTLQRHAYEEIRHKVQIAVRGHLPSELMMTIFKQALVDEEIPLDPRIFLQARHAVSGELRRKTRLICEHVARVMSDEPWLRLPKQRGLIMAGPAWVELRPQYSHYNDWARREENLHYVYTKFGKTVFGHEPEIYTDDGNEASMNWYGSETEGETLDAEQES